MRRTANEWAPSAALSQEHKQLVAHLLKVRQDNGPVSLRQIGQRLHLAHSRVHALLHGKAVPADEQQVRDLVRAGLGGSVEDADRAAYLLARIPRRFDRRGASGWMWAGPEVRGHFTRRGLGQRSGGQGGDLFHGRAVAVSKVRAWLRDGMCPGLPLVVTGQPGAGKSAVVARVVLELDAAGYGPGLAIHARDATHRDVLDAVAMLTGHPKNVDQFTLVEALALADGRRVWPIVIDALDEAHSQADRGSIVQLIGELAGLPCVRIVVATRPLAAGDRYTSGALLPDLQVTGPDSPNLVDLDGAVYFDRNALVGFAAALLVQDGVPRPGPPERAWRQYRDDPGLVGRLAERIADRAGRSFLVAALAGYSLSTAAVVVDPAAAEFKVSGIPASVREAVNKYLDVLSDRDRAQVRGLLTALAYARGTGIDDAAWIRSAAALGYPASTVDLDRLRDSTAADYLLQTSSDPVGEPVTRLFHEALAEDLLAPRRPQQISDERAILATIRPSEADGWKRACRYARAHAADHAVAAGCLPDLLREPHYLAVADLDRLLPVLPARPTPDLAPITAVLRRASARARTLPPHRRASLLALTAAHLGHHELYQRLAAAHDGPYLVQWAHSLGIAHQQLSGHTGWIGAVAVGRLGDQDVIVSAGRDKTVRVWDQHGQPLGNPLRGHTGSVDAVAVGRLGDRDVIVSGGGDGDATLRIWDQHGHPVGPPLVTEASWISAVAVGRLGDRDVIVSGGGDGDATLQVWDQHGHLAGAPLMTQTGDNDWISALTLGRLGGQDVIVSASGDGVVRQWDQHGPIGDPLTRHTGSVGAVAVGRLGGQDVIVTGGSDTEGIAQVCVWDQHGHLVGEPLAIHEGWVNELAVGRLGNRDVIVFYVMKDSTDDDEMVRVWDPHSYPTGDPLTGHTGSVEALALGRLGDRDVIASASADGTVRVWDPHGQQVEAAFTGHTGWVGAVAMGRLGNRDVIVSGGGSDMTVCVWDQHGQPIGNPLTGHTGSIVALTMGRWGARDVIVSGSRDMTVRVWDQHGQPIGNPLTGHTDWVTTVAVGRLGDRDVIVSGSRDGTMWVWDEHGNPIGSPFTGHTDWVGAVAIGRLGDRDVIVSGGDDTVRVWDQPGKPIGSPFTGHTDWVYAVAIGRLGNQDVIISGSRDGTVRVWHQNDQLDQLTCDVIDFLEEVAAVCLVHHSTEIYVASGRSLSRLDLNQVQPNDAGAQT